jgi:hypothetical protein
MGILRITVIVLSAALAGCAYRYDVSRDFDPAANFAALHSFGWMPDVKVSEGDILVESDTLLRQRVQSAVDRELSLKGFQKRASEPQDFWVAYHAALKRKVEVITYNGYYGYGYGWWGRPWGYPVGLGPQTYMRDYDEHMLVLDIIDPKTRQLLWRATTRDGLGYHGNPEERDQRVNEAVRQMLSEFPPVKKP